VRALYHRSSSNDFLANLGISPKDEDSEKKLLDAETQLAWLREIGFVDSDCRWKWRVAWCLPSKANSSA